MAGTLAPPPPNENTVRARSDIQLQRAYDRRHTGNAWGLYQARVAAVNGAREAVELDLDPAARFALRQALVDLAACCERMAATMRAPTARVQRDVPRSR
jgi:hypothetical protein